MSKIIIKTLGNTHVIFKNISLKTRALSHIDLCFSLYRTLYCHFLNLLNKLYLKQIPILKVPPDANNQYKIRPNMIQNNNEKLMAILAGNI